MTEIIVPAVRPFYRGVLDDMYRMRYEVVVGKWGWKVPGIAEGYDKDNYDTDETVYLVELDGARRQVLGCCRFNPTTGPYMIADLWPEACDLQAPPRDSRTWETSRFVVSSRIKLKEEYFEVMWRLGVGLAEYCLRAGIERIVWFTDPAFYQTINAMMEVEPLGRPRHHEEDGRTYIPGMGTISAEAVAAAKRNLRRPEEAVTFAMAPIASVEAPHFVGRREAA